MSQQGPIITVSTAGRPPFAAALTRTGMFPVIDTLWPDAAGAIEQLRPAAVLVAMSEIAAPDLEILADRVAACTPYLPLIAVDPEAALPPNVIPFSQGRVADVSNCDRLTARLRSALRVRALHDALLRRAAGEPTRPAIPSPGDSARHATALLIGRGVAYPSLSVSLGERMGVVGALSIEAAARHLNTRDIDGIVLGEGFSPRVVDAFLAVLAEDARFRNMPIALTCEGPVTAHALPNFEIISGDPERIAANAVALIGQHAFEAHLSRALRALEANGLLDARTGLLTPDAFHRDFASAIAQTQSRGGGLSAARFTFDHPRAQFDGARIVSRLMRQADFGVAEVDGSVIVAFGETDLRTAHMIARRLASVMAHTSHGRNVARSRPAVTIATLLPGDSAGSLLARLKEPAQRAVS